MPRLIWVFAGRTCHFVGFVWHAPAHITLIWSQHSATHRRFGLIVFPLSTLLSSCEPWHDKTNKVSVRPAKTQISLGIRPVWSESSLSAWRKLGSLATHWVHSEDSDQTGRMPRLIWVFAARTLTLLVLSCRGSCSNRHSELMWIRSPGLRPELLEPVECRTQNLETGNSGHQFLDFDAKFGALNFYCMYILKVKR